jgi:ankyrin repeat protein
VAAERGNVEILDQLWAFAKEVRNRDDLNNKLLLAKDDDKNTVLHHASFSGNVQLLERIWKWAKEQMTKEE